MGCNLWRYQLIGPRRETPFRDQRGVEIPHSARGGVTGIGVQRLACGFLLLVDPLEVLLGQIDFAAHLDASLRTAAQRQRNRAHGAHVLRHVVATAAVTTGGAANQPSVFIGERDAEAIDLELCYVGRAAFAKATAPRLIPADAFTNALVERAQVGFVVGVVEAEHRLHVLDLRKTLGRPAADALGRRIGGEQLGMCGFDRLELVHQGIECLVRDLGRGVDVIQLFVPANFLAECFGSLGGCHDNALHRNTEPQKHRKTNYLCFSVSVFQCDAFQRSLSRTKSARAISASRSGLGANTRSCRLAASPNSTARP